MNRLNLLNYLPIIISACFLFTLILGVVILWPKYQDLKEIQRNIEDKKLELQYQEEYFSSLSETKNKLDKYGTELSKINSTLPDNPSLPSLFNFFQTVSSQSGLVLKEVGAFSISFSREFPDLNETQFSLQVSGSYSSLKNFLSILENSARLIEVENVSFNSPIEGNSFTFNLKIKTYSY